MSYYDKFMEVVSVLKENIHIKVVLSHTITDIEVVRTKAMKTKLANKIAFQLKNNEQRIQKIL